MVTKVGSQNFGYQIWLCTRQIYEFIMRPEKFYSNIPVINELSKTNGLNWTMLRPTCEYTQLHVRSEGISMQLDVSPGLGLQHLDVSASTPNHQPYVFWGDCELMCLDLGQTRRAGRLWVFWDTCALSAVTGYLRRYRNHDGDSFNNKHVWSFSGPKCYKIPSINGV